MKDKIEDLLNNDAFTNRHIGSSSEQKNRMLNYLGFDNLDKLIDEIVPDHIIIPPIGIVPVALVPKESESNSAFVCDINLSTSISI